uniref:chorismate mutase n=1 Tax=uncultured Chloroflexota bacterium TaxID=166587 RepID=H5SMX2_9CHLR|nr:chorismate mutase [uncultured Chloroflexota bacterium]
MPIRALRGATTVEEDRPEVIWSATQELLLTLLEANQLQPQAIISAIFTVTPDLTTAFPATAARRLGWQDVPLLDMLAPAVPGDIPRCIRVLLHIETTLPSQALRHIYLHRARTLRPEWAGEPL